ncbi:hypothetical protein FACS189426_02380 [Bacteroidia bacterium]|nr:hypothetical protein FACS189426_02380 [Bacteroidia bacterium]
MSIKNYYVIILLLFVSAYVKAQEQKIVEVDSVQDTRQFFDLENPVILDSTKITKGMVKLIPENFKPDPNKAILYSAIVPGLGQIYNRKYWKLPLVYGSFIGCVYAVNWNGTQYNGYKNAHKDFIDDNPKTDSWKAYRYYSLPENLEEWSPSQVNEFSGLLKSGKDYYRRYRDMSYFITVGVYAIWIIDAYVDAQLFDFDISPDLSMRVNPVLYERTSISSRSIGLQCSFTF